MIRDSVKTLAKLINDLQPEMQQIIADIHSKPETGENRYDQYLSVLCRVQTEQGSTYRNLVAVSLIKAGGNREGIKAALSILGE